MNFMAFGLKHEPNSIAGKLLHDTQVTYKARGPSLTFLKKYVYIDKQTQLYYMTGSGWSAILIFNE